MRAEIQLRLSATVQMSISLLRGAVVSPIRRHGGNQRRSVPHDYDLIDNDSGHAVTARRISWSSVPRLTACLYSSMPWTVRRASMPNSELEGSSPIILRLVATRVMWFWIRWIQELMVNEPRSGVDQVLTGRPVSLRWIIYHFMHW